MAKNNDRNVVFLDQEVDGSSWIGFKALSITGEEKEFFWWKNYAVPLDKLKVFCGSLLAQRLIEAQIGPAVDLRESLNAKPRVCLISETDDHKPVYGVYIESRHRVMFSFFLSVEGLQLPTPTRKEW